MFRLDTFAPRFWKLNSHECSLPIILDRDVEQLIKRRKLSHPRFGALHEVGGSQLQASSQHAGNVEMRHSGESPLPGREGNGDDRSCMASKIVTGMGSGEDVGRSRLRPMIGMVSTASDMTIGKVCGGPALSFWS